MRHARSALYALVLAPLVWMLSAVGLGRDLAGRAFTGGVTVETLGGIAIIAIGGAAYALLLLPRLSPAGPLLAGVLYLAATGWSLADPEGFGALFPPSVEKPGFDLTLPARGLGLLLAVPLLGTAFGMRRWRRHDHPAPAAAAHPTAPYPYPPQLYAPQAARPTRTMPAVPPTADTTQVVPAAPDTVASEATQVITPATIVGALNPRPSSDATQVMSGEATRVIVPAAADSGSEPTRVISPATVQAATAPADDSPTRVIRPGPVRPAPAAAPDDAEATSVLGAAPDDAEATSVLGAAPDDAEASTADLAASSKANRRAERGGQTRPGQTAGNGATATTEPAGDPPAGPGAKTRPGGETTRILPAQQRKAATAERE